LWVLIILILESLSSMNCQFMWKPHFVNNVFDLILWIFNHLWFCRKSD
jgi:hypothetical protein